jgi:hypothetical protein
VVAVAATVTVPQFVTHRAAPPTVIAPATSAPPAEDRSATYAFRGYSAGRFTVADPDRWAVTGQTAMIFAAGDKSPVGVLTAFHPGVEPAEAGKRTGTDPVTGRTAFFLASANIDQLVWDYADGATAAVSPLGGRLTRSDMRRIAEGFTLGNGPRVTLAFRAGYVPTGYRLLRFGGRNAIFEPSEQTAARLARPDRRLPGGEPGKTLSINLTDADASRDLDPGPYCTDRHSCYRRDGKTGPKIVVAADAVPPAELVKVLQSVTVGETPVGEAIPAYARP